MLNAGGHACAVIAMFQVGGGSFTHVIKASEPVVSVILGLAINGAVPKPLTALSLLPITYGVAYASTLGQLDVVTMSRELGTMAAKWVTLKCSYSSATSVSLIPNRSMGQHLRQWSYIDEIFERNCVKIVPDINATPSFRFFPLHPFSTDRMAMGSNVAFALRSIMKKNLPKDFKVSPVTLICS
jgi:Triose-phosphate Transporter family